MKKSAHNVVGLPTTDVAKDSSFAVFKYPVEDGEVTMKMERLLLQRISALFSEVSHHLQIETARAAGHALVSAMDAVNLNADNLIGTGRIGLRVQTNNGQALLYALTADQAKALIALLSKLEPVARAEMTKTLQ